jgi:hypothetical protein
MHQISIANARTYRGEQGTAAINVGRPSPLGNPFRMNSEAERDKVCDQYEAWFKEKVRAKDTKVMAELQRIQGIWLSSDIALKCWCHPKRCHAETIRGWLLANTPPPATEQRAEQGIGQGTEQSKPLRTIIAGSRSITAPGSLERAIQNSGFSIGTVISGTARGVDQLGEAWARRNSVRLEQCPADWGKYGRSAGYIRNQRMVDTAEAAIVVWDGRSRGSQHTIGIARKKGIPVYVEIA